MCIILKTWNVYQAFCYLQLKKQLSFPHNLIVTPPKLSFLQDLFFALFLSFSFYLSTERSKERVTTIALRISESASKLSDIRNECGNYNPEYDKYQFFGWILCNQ